MRDALERVFYEYVYGDWDSLRRWAWIYVHVGVMLATVLVGYTLARGEYVLTLLLVPFPLGFLRRRYTYAKRAREGAGSDGGG